MVDQKGDQKGASGLVVDDGKLREIESKRMRWDFYYYDFFAYLFLKIDCCANTVSVQALEV